MSTPPPTAAAARLIDGKALAARIGAALTERLKTLPWRPGLRVFLVGENPASALYVRNKERTAAASGFAAHTERLPAGTEEAALIEHIALANADPSIDGILVQLPLPRSIRAERVIEAIDPAKDVDGFHPLNAGLLALGRPALVPCTPLGVMKLLAEVGAPVAGVRAVVIGRSMIVGRPLALLLTAADATVTLAHSRTHDLAGLCREAELVVAATGKAEMVRGDWIAPGATVIDVGINRLADGRVVGDVAFAEAAARAGAITPVPGGVGPMTIAMLLENTLAASLRRRSEACLSSLGALARKAASGGGPRT